jgi:hypothetical protein
MSSPEFRNPKDYASKLSLLVPVATGGEAQTYSAWFDSVSKDIRDVTGDPDSQQAVLYHIGAMSIWEASKTLQTDLMDKCSPRLPAGSSIAPASAYLAFVPASNSIEGDKQWLKTTLAELGGQMRDSDLEPFIDQLDGAKAARYEETMYRAMLPGRASPIDATLGPDTFWSDPE